MKKLDDKIYFKNGISMKNAFALAPMTNQQSHEDGVLSKEELHWLTMRAKGQFGLVMTCASNVQANGKCWPGQLGIYDDRHIEGHQKLAKSIHQHGSISIVQLHHGGMRAPQEIIKEQAICPSNNTEFDARAMSTQEIQVLKIDFISAAKRAQKAGHDGIELHGAHGYLLCQFLSSEINQRTDEYGGSLENRARIISEIIDGIRSECGDDFLLGIRLSPERFGMEKSEIRDLIQGFITGGKLDFIDISLWDVFKKIEHSEQGLLDYFTVLDYQNVLLTVAGKISTATDVQKVLDKGVDFISIGRSAILHHDFPMRVIQNHQFTTIQTPVSERYLRKEGLGETFIQYMRKWKGFVQEEET